MVHYSVRKPMNKMPWEFQRMLAITFPAEGDVIVNKEDSRGLNPTDNVYNEHFTEQWHPYFQTTC